MRPSRRATLAALALVVAASPLPAQRRKDPWPAFDAVVQRGMKDWGIPGLAVAVVRNDSVLFLRGYGVRRLGDTARVDPATRFGIMSTTKAMTTLAVAMLVDEGKLRWDDPVTKWLPGFATASPLLTREMRVVDLLTHNSGLPGADLLWVRGDLSEGDILARLSALEPVYPLRGGFAYQNTLYGAAGAVVARASGMPWDQFVRTRILEPLGMTRSHPLLADVVAAGDPNVSAPHYRIRDTVRVIAEESVDVVGAAGAAWSTAADMATWARFLLDSARVNGRRLVSDSSFRRLFAPHAIIPPGEFYPTATLTKPHWTTYGLGWFQQDYRGEMVQMHTGSLDGRTAIIGLIPERRMGVVVLGNLDHAELRHALLWQAFDVMLGAPSRDWHAEVKALYDARRARGDSARAATMARRTAGTSPSLPLARYAGRYEHPVWADLQVEEEGDGLRVRYGSGPSTRGSLEHWHYDTFLARLGDGRGNPEFVTFQLDAAGA
ncbi:MAG TPA: serine hydrolase, partial [Gemmatimonadales bacterium]|nr:serine hydrolase [Gemmatimonadales bacterium]